MIVFKFGGASISTVERIQRLAGIIESYPRENILIVVSAMGKTTNALEKVAEAYYAGNPSGAQELYSQVKAQHQDTARKLLVKELVQAEETLQRFFTEVEWMLHDRPQRAFDYYYDQIVSTGELLSSFLVSAFLKESGIENSWVDVRDLFRTDDHFRDAGIDWEVTENQVKKAIPALFEKTRIIVTQGFIGSTDENESTTLGREGSDYTAAIFANMLEADSVTIWKDVEGVLNADPKTFTGTVFISELNYDEIIEMSYYGAQVIHPKTIKPLQNKSIPLYVKCFLDPSLPGTVIHNSKVHQLPPVIVWKHHQVLLYLHSKDFSFVGEKLISRLYDILAEGRLSPNLLQTGAVTLMLCIDDTNEKTSFVSARASELFDVRQVRGLSILTIRHYTEDIINRLVEGREVLLRQQTPHTVQLLVGE